MSFALDGLAVQKRTASRLGDQKTYLKAASDVLPPKKNTVPHSLLMGSKFKNAYAHGRSSSHKQEMPRPPIRPGGLGIFVTT